MSQRLGSSPRPRVLIASVLAFVQATLAAPAFGQAPPEKPPATAEEKAAAMRKYEEGSRAFRQKRYKDAIDLFLEADSVVKNADLAYNAALAYDAMGDASSALNWAREYLRRRPEAEDRPGVEKRIDALELRLQKKGVQQVTVSSAPTGATVLIDEKPVGVTPWTGDLHPGGHRLELRLLGHQIRQETFDLRPEVSLDVRVELQVEAPTPAQLLPAQPPPPPALARPAPPQEEESSGSPLTPIGVTVLLAGAATCGAGIGLEFLRRSAESDASEAAFQVDVPGHIERMEDYQLGARIAVGVGGGLGLAGGTMLIIGLATGSSPVETSQTVSTWCGVDACGIQVRGRY